MGSGVMSWRAATKISIESISTCCMHSSKGSPAPPSSLEPQPF